MGSLLYKYPCYPTIRHFAPVIHGDFNKPCGLAYKIYKGQLELETNSQKRGHTRELKLGQTSNLIQLDECFQNIPPFTGLKLFGHYSKVVQWLGNEQKAIVKQLIAAAILLLI